MMGWRLLIINMGVEPRYRPTLLVVIVYVVRICAWCVCWGVRYDGHAFSVHGNGLTTSFHFPLLKTVSAGPTKPFDVSSSRIFILLSHSLRRRIKHNDRWPDLDETFSGIYSANWFAVCSVLLGKNNCWGILTKEEILYWSILSSEYDSFNEIVQWNIDRWTLNAQWTCYIPLKSTAARCHSEEAAWKPMTISSPTFKWRDDGQIRKLYRRTTKEGFSIFFLTPLKSEPHSKKDKLASKSSQNLRIKKKKGHPATHSTIRMMRVNLLPTSHR